MKYNGNTFVGLSEDMTCDVRIATAAVEALPSVSQPLDFGALSPSVPSLTVCLTFGGGFWFPQTEVGCGSLFEGVWGGGVEIPVRVVNS